MRVCELTIKRFRGIREATILLPHHCVLIGDNNIGKTTILEALDLVLGPDRLSRQPPIDEHDFFRGHYRPSPPAGGEVGDVATAPAAGGGGPMEAPATEEDLIQIEIEATICELNEEQKGSFGDSIEFWDSNLCKLYTEAAPEGVDPSHISEALRVTFQGRYLESEDDFEGATYFTRSLTEDPKPAHFSKRHKQICGFLYLRTVRTGSRALSLERGSLLDIILRLKEVRPKMWEATLNELAELPVAADAALGISPVLHSINSALKKYVPKEWGIEPHLKVSNLTREHLRKVITAFIATGEGSHAAPFYRQGTGTLNMLVLAMLSLIAADKQNVIFAMEEPETAIPPYAQKRIVHEVRKLASQTIFTSHSPYVLEEFAIHETVILARDAEGSLTRKDLTLPENLKLKRYRQQFRTRFCEGLLSRRVLVAEGATETAAFPAACRRLEELQPTLYTSLEALGICIVDADSDSNISGIAELYRGLGKQTFAICDRQEPTSQASIEAHVDLLLMHDQHGFEDLVLNGTTQEALERFARLLEWPPHLATEHPNRLDQPLDAMRAYFRWAKGNWGIADFLAQCTEAETPAWIKEAATRLREFCQPPAPVELRDIPGGPEPEAAQ